MGGDDGRDGWITGTDEKGTEEKDEKGAEEKKTEKREGREREEYMGARDRAGWTGRNKVGESVV